MKTNIAEQSSSPSFTFYFQLYLISHLAFVCATEKNSMCVFCCSMTRKPALAAAVVVLVAHHLFLRDMLVEIIHIYLYCVHLPMF